MIDVALEVRNAGAAPASAYTYFQLTHDGKPDIPTNSVAATFGAQSFIGFGVYTNEHNYQKVHLSDLDKGKSDHVKQADNGWLAFVQHYFVSAWMPGPGVARDYGTEKRQDGTYAGRVMVPLNVAPGTTRDYVTEKRPDGTYAGRLMIPANVAPGHRRAFRRRSTPARRSSGACPRPRPASTW